MLILCFNAFNTNPPRARAHTHTHTKNTQVFFKAGVLGQLEEMRDDKLAKIITWMQSFIRGYHTRKQYKQLQDQR